MIGLLFVYAFMWGACYVVGLNHLNNQPIQDRYGFLNRPLSLLFTALWPLMFLIFLVRLVYKPPGHPISPALPPEDNPNGVQS